MTAAIPADLDDDIAEAARIIVSAYYSDYLAIRGKSRWCDKSLDNYMFAPLLRQVFPDAQFICLYRHCMDMVASGIEACPLGMSGYGFDAFAHQFPSNNVAAAGACWLTNARDTLEFEEANRERCLRVRYEDLVSDTDQVASSIFNFLGVQQVDDISRLCFESEHDRPGPGDHKIWFTNRILQHSMGRGRKIPGSALPPPLLKEINDALGPMALS